MKVFCPVCNGTGAHTHEDVHTCPLCRGEKYVESQESFDEHFLQALSAEPHSQSAGPASPRLCLCLLRTTY